MAKLIWHPGGGSPRAYILNQDRISLGRDPGCNLVLDDPSVSARHAVVVVGGGVTTVHDMQSRNGTWINGEKIELKALQHGDVLMLGRQKLTFIDESQAASSVMAKGLRGGTAILTEKRPAASPLQAMPLVDSQNPAPPPVVDFAELDRVLDGVRAQRKAQMAVEDQKVGVYRREWEHLLRNAEMLRGRLSDEPRVRFFDISTRRNEIVLRIETRPNQPLYLLQMTLGHPDYTSGIPDGLWLRQTGQTDNRYDDHQSMMREVLAILSSMLA